MKKFPEMFAWMGQNCGQKGIGRGHKCGFANVVMLGCDGKTGVGVREGGGADPSMANMLKFLFGNF